MKVVQVNSDQLKKLSQDPVATFLETVNKLQFISTIPPSIKKDIRQIQIESFHRALFSKGNSGATIKNEILKLHNGSRDKLAYGPKTMTYEVLLQVMEDMLREHSFNN